MVVGVGVLLAMVAVIYGLTYSGPARVAMAHTGPTPTSLGIAGGVSTTSTTGGPTTTVQKLPTLADEVNRLIAQMPGRASGAYVPMTTEEQDGFRGFVNALVTEGTPDIGRLAESVGYSRIQVQDQERTVLVFFEARTGSVLLRGWPSLVLAPDGKRIAIEVPHPIADAATEDIGLALFRSSNSQLLIIAGTHRDYGGSNAADVAHLDTSGFQTAHEVAVDAGFATTQIHGWSNDQHPNIEVDIIFSNGTPHASTLVELAASRFGTDSPIVGCAYGSAGCDGLGAETNIQAMYATQEGADFLHIEISRSVRDDRKLTEYLVERLGSILSQFSAAAVVGPR